MIHYNFEYEGQAHHELRQFYDGPLALPVPPSGRTWSLRTRIAHRLRHSGTARFTLARRASEGDSCAVPRLRFGLASDDAQSGRMPDAFLGHNRSFPGTQYTNCVKSISLDRNPEHQ